jgi:hypothetical protein
MQETGSRDWRGAREREKILKKEKEKCDDKTSKRLEYTKIAVFFFIFVE